MFLFRGKSKEGETKAVRANLGEQSTMYYDPEKKRWRERGKEHLEKEEDELAPPPMAKPKEEKPENDDGPPPTAAPKKELTGVDALIAPPNPYANRLGNKRAGGAARPPTGPPLGAFGVTPSVPAAAPVAEGEAPEEAPPGEAAGGEAASGEAPATTGGAPTNPFGSATPAAGVAANPFAPRGLNRTVTQPFNPNAPRGMGAATPAGQNPHAPRARRQPPAKPQQPAARAGPFGPAPTGGATVPPELGDPEGGDGEEASAPPAMPSPHVAQGDELYASAGTGAQAPSAAARRAAPPPLAEGTGKESAAEGAADAGPTDAGTPAAIPPSPYSAHMPAYSPISPAVGRGTVTSRADHTAVASLRTCAAPSAAAANGGESEAESAPPPQDAEGGSLEDCAPAPGTAAAAPAEAVVPTPGAAEAGAPAPAAAEEISTLAFGESVGRVAAGLEGPPDEVPAAAELSKAPAAVEAPAVDTAEKPAAEVDSKVVREGGYALEEASKGVEAKEPAEEAAIPDLVTTRKEEAKAGAECPEAAATDFPKAEEDIIGELLAEEPSAPAEALALVPLVAAAETAASPEEDADKAKEGDGGWGNFDFDEFEDSTPGGADTAATFAEAPLTAAAAASADAKAPEEAEPEAAGAAAADAAAASGEPADAAAAVAMAKEPCVSNDESTSSWVFLTDDAQADTHGSGKMTAPNGAAASAPSKAEEEPAASEADMPGAAAAPMAGTAEEAAPEDIGMAEEAKMEEPAPEEAAPIPAQSDVFAQLPQELAAVNGPDIQADEVAANGPDIQADEGAAVAASGGQACGAVELFSLDDTAGAAAQPPAIAAEKDLLEDWLAGPPEPPAVVAASAPGELPAPELPPSEPAVEAELAELRARMADLERQLVEAKRLAVAREEELQAATCHELERRERAEAALAETKSQLEAEREEAARQCAQEAQRKVAAAEAETAAAPRAAGEGDEEFNLPDFVWSCGNSEVMAFVQKIVGENARLRQQAAAVAGPASAPGEPAAAQAAPVTAASPPFDAMGTTPEQAAAFADGVGEDDSHQVAPLLALLQEHAGDLKVCSQVCAALETLTFTLPENRQAIVQKGGAKVVIEILARNLDAEAALLRPVIGALWNLTFEDEAVDSAMEAQGVERITALMRKHGGEAELLGAASAVLMNLAVREQNRWGIVESGGVALVASAMQEHSQNEEVLELGCQALYMLAYHKDLKPLVLAAKGGDAAALAASCPRSGGRAQKWGRWLQEVLAC